MNKFLRIGTPVKYHDADGTVYDASITHIWDARMVNLEYEVITAGTLSLASPDDAPPATLPTEKRVVTSVPYATTAIVGRRAFSSDDELSYQWTSPRSVPVNGLHPLATVTVLNSKPVYDPAQRDATINIVKDGNEYKAFNLFDEEKPEFLETAPALAIIAWLEQGAGLPI